MEMILLDWTRMGRTYCLAGAVAERGTYRVVRPIQTKARQAPVRNVGWSPYLFDGHSRWEVFELMDCETAPPEPPHLEDVWVRAMRSRKRLATPAERRAVLAATVKGDGDLFGAPLTLTYAAAHLQPGSGTRSLATVLVPADQITFAASHRQGIVEPDVRASVPLPGVGERQLPVKDHHLLARAELASRDLDSRLRELTRAIRQMGDTVAVRLGLSRAFLGNPGRAPAMCWLMADGFFSLADPQP